MDTSPTVRSTNNTLVFLIRVGSLATSFASTWRAMSVADPPASPVAVVKRSGKSFPIIIGSSAPCAASAWPQTYLLLPAGPLKKYIVAGQNKRDDCFLLFHDDARQSSSRSMRRSIWTHTAPALQLQDQKEQQTNQPDEGKRPMTEAKITPKSNRDGKHQHF